MESGLMADSVHIDFVQAIIGTSGPGVE